MIFTPLLFSNTSADNPPMKYVVACQNNIIVTSNDAISWTSRSIPLDYNYIPANTNSFTNIRYHTGKYYVMSNNVKITPSSDATIKLLTSPDAINWTTLELNVKTKVGVTTQNLRLTTLNDSMNLNGFTYMLGDVRTLLGFTPDYFYQYKSYDSISYDFKITAPSLGPTILRTYIYDNTAYYMTASYDIANNRVIGDVIRSNDGKTFTRFGQANIYPNDITYHTGINSGFYAAGDQGIWRYITATNIWQRRIIATAERMVNSPTTMIAYNRNNNTAYRSTDGLNWFTITLPSPATINITYDGTRFILCNPNGAYSSNDGLTWNLISNISWNNYYPVSIYSRPN
jgi:hypothetical protein